MGDKEMKQGLTRRDLLGLVGKTTLAARLYSIPAFGESTPIFNGHMVLLDAQGKILPWAPAKQSPYDYFLHLRWDFIKTKVPMCPGPAPARLIRSTIFIAPSGIGMESSNQIPG
jgi:hypothetical protein